MQHHQQKKINGFENMLDWTHFNVNSWFLLINGYLSL